MRKTLIVFLCLVLCVVFVSVPVSASTVNGHNVIDYNDYISNVKVDGDNDIVTVTFPDDMYSTTQTDINGTSFKRGIISGDLYMVSNTSDVIVNACVNCPGGAVGNNYLDLSNIPDGSVFTTTNKVTLDSRITGTWIDYKLNYRSRIAYFDEDFNLIDQQTSPLTEKAYDSGIWDYELVYEIAIDKPDSAKYCFTYFYFQVSSFAERDDIAVVSYKFVKPQLKMSISSLYRLQEQTGKTNELLEELPEEIGAQFKDVIQEEQDKAEVGGNSSVGELESVIPDHSAGFMEALQGFAECMSYTGTDAKLKIPGITMPEIAGLIPKYEIMEGTTLDFGVYIGYLPDGLLLLVQSLLTIALIIYCFKELYDTVAYVLTLRRSTDG